MPKSIDFQNADAINELGISYFGLQLLQLATIIDDQGDRLMRESGFSTPSQVSSTLEFLRRNGPSSVANISRFLCISRQLIAYRIKRLKSLGLVSAQPDPSDARRTLLALTKSGKRQAEDLAALDHDIEAAYCKLFEEVGVNLFQAIIEAKHQLLRRDLAARVGEVNRAPISGQPGPQD